MGAKANTGKHIDVLQQQVKVGDVVAFLESKLTGLKLGRAEEISSTGRTVFVRPFGSGHVERVRLSLLVKVTEQYEALVINNPENYL